MHVQIGFNPKLLASPLRSRYFVASDVKRLVLLEIFSFCERAVLKHSAARKMKKSPAKTAGSRRGVEIA